MTNETQTPDVAVATPGTALATLEESAFIALRPGGEYAETLACNFGEGEQIQEQDLLRVKTPSGGGVIWTIPDLEGESMEREITGALVYYGNRGLLWPSEDPGNAMPVLRTDDLRWAYRVGEELGDIDPDVLAAHEVNPGTYDWAALVGTDGPFGFGSGKGGVGKRAKEMKIMCILREDDIFPLLICAGPGSLVPVTRFVHLLKVPYFRAVVNLGLVKKTNPGGIDYAQITPTLNRSLSPEEGAAIKTTYTDQLAATIKRMGFGVDED